MSRIKEIRTKLAAAHDATDKTLNDIEEHGWACPDRVDLRIRLALYGLEDAVLAILKDVQ